jgi:zinc-ribbon domain
MFCQNCGAQVQPGQPYCSACAKPLTGYGAEQKSRFQRHFHLLGIFWIAYSVFSFIGGVVLLIIANTLFGGLGRYDTGAPEFLHPLLTAIAVFLLLKSIVGIAAGWGLLQHFDWARVLSIVLGFLELLHVPLGTILGIYTIWALLSPGADREYRSLAGTAVV